MRKIASVCMMIMITCFLTACSGSYREWEDSVLGRNRDLNVENGTQMESTLEHVFSVGETITDNMVGEETQYTLKSVNIVKNVNDIGITREDFPDDVRSKVLRNGELNTEEESRFVMVTMVVKNVNAEPDGMQMIEMDAGCESTLKDGDSILHMAEYYRDISGKHIGEPYFNSYFLEKGEEMTVQLGWFVPVEELQEPFYYVIGTWGTIENYQYFWLNEK